jgi:integral membrane protein
MKREHGGEDEEVHGGRSYLTNVTFVRALRQLALIEGVSTLLLFFVAMPLKYLAGMPLAVTIVGSIHGFLFVALVVMLLIAIVKVPISAGLAAAGIVAAVVPGGPFLLERRLAKIG